MRLLLVGLVVLLGGCAAHLPPPALVVPDMPVLPVVMAAELECLSEDAYLRLLERELRLRGHIAELQALLR